MRKSIVAGAALALAFAAGQGARSLGIPVELQEESMVIEYSATFGEAAIVVSAEAETTIGRVEMRGPAGPPILEMRTDRGPDLGVQGFVVETGEAPLDELLAAYPEGEYPLRARTTDGQIAFGSAVLSHALPEPPQIVYPVSGGSEVPVADFMITWTPDPGVASYRVNLEQGETDLMTVVVDGSSGSFRVPDGVLAAGTRSQLELAAIGPDGNRTVVEIRFMTQ